LAKLDRFRGAAVAAQLSWDCGTAPFFWLQKGETWQFFAKSRSPSSRLMGAPAFRF